VILRLSNVYGPRQGLKKPSGLISILTKSFLEGKEVTLFAPKMMTRDYIYVEDVVEAMCLSAEKIDEGVFNVSSCTQTSNLEVYQLVSKEIPGTYNVGPYREGEIKRIFLDNSRAKRIMGWEPKTSLEAGIKKTVSFYREWLKR
jgi:UDP-glucose 4-epimerase